MGGRSKSQTVGYRYYMGLHFGLCHGPVDRVTEVKVGDRVVWQGSIESNQTKQVDSPDLFGGDKKEGGIVGSLEVNMGGSGQGVSSYLQSKIGGVIPAFRGILSAVWRGQVAANNPYVKPWAFTVCRILQGWTGGGAWYPPTAPIPLPQVFQPGTWKPDRLDPRGLTTGYEYQAQNSSVWHEKIEDAISELPYPEVAEVMVGWSQGISAQLYHGANNEEPAPSATLILHMNRKLPDGGVYYETMPEGNEMHGYFCSNFAAEGLAPRQKLFWWTGLSDMADLDTAAGVSYQPYPYVSNAAPYRPGLYRLEYASVEQHDGELMLNNCTNYPFVESSFPRAFYTPDALIKVRVAQREAFAMNPAHIVYQCLTDTSWGMGYPTSAIDEASFTTAADTLFAESFGLCMVWNQQETIENFIRTVLDHAGGILYVQPSTGKFALKLIRADYDRNTLPVYGPSNLVAATNYQRQAWGETTNEVTVVYREYWSNKDAAVTVQDLANIQTQGAVVAAVKQYRGLPTAELSQRVAMRDLNAMSTPLAKITLTANRAAWSVIPGGVIRLTWPDFEIDDVVFRVLEVNSGTLQNGEIKIEAVEDIFALPTNTYVAEQAGGWIEPGNAPEDATYRKLLETPYWDLARTLSAADLAYLDPLAGYLQTLCARPSGDSINYEVNAKTGAAAYAAVATANFCPTATLVSAIGKTATSIAYENGINMELAETGGYAMLGDEVVGITAIDTGTGTMTITRGLLDTVPVAHAVGERIWLADTYTGNDPTEYALGEVVDVKMLPRTGLGELAIENAGEESITIDRRQNKPYPPGKLRVNTQTYPEWIDGAAALTLTWAHRDRLTQTAYLVTQDENSIGPEASTTYTLRIYGEADTLKRTESGLTGTAYTYLTGDEIADNGGSGDVHYSNVSLLLNMNGANGSTTFTDNSSSPKTVTANGNAQISTAQSKWGGASAYFGGPGDQLNVASNSGLSLTGDYTVEAWVRPTTLALACIADFRSVGGQVSVSLNVNANGSIGTYIHPTVYDSNPSISKLTVGEWGHIAICRSGNTGTFFINGIACGTYTHTAPGAGGQQLRVGLNVDNGLQFNGYIDDLRITKGVARYTSAFAPPTAQFPTVVSGRVNGRLRFELESVRGGVPSHTYHEHTVLREGYGFNYGYYYGGQ